MNEKWLIGGALVIGGGMLLLGAGQIAAPDANRPVDKAVAGLNALLRNPGEILKDPKKLASAALEVTLNKLTNLGSHYNKGVSAEFDSYVKENPEYDPTDPRTLGGYATKHSSDGNFFDDAGAALSHVNPLTWF